VFPIAPLILLILKLQVGRLVREPFSLKEAKKLFPGTVILLVSKLHTGRLVREPEELKEVKK
jgi:hypothetical protein